MKKPLLLLLAILSSSLIFSQLNENANALKTEKPETYQKIKTFAEQDWKGDHRMMVYKINKQADALFEIHTKFTQAKDYDEKILVNAYSNWSTKINGTTYYDYTMILYEYKKEIKAKNQY